jgi:hypothetical protein
MGELTDLTPVARIEVKRCFVVGERAKEPASQNPSKIVDELPSIVSQVEEMNEPALDAYISRKDPMRLQNYNSHTWELKDLQVDSVGVWCGVDSGAKGMPVEWCLGPINMTAKFVKTAKNRGQLSMEAPDVDTAIIGMLKIMKFMVDQPSLRPIALPSDKVRFHPACTRLDCGFNDGNMRALSLTIAGRSTIAAYVGVGILG